MPCTSGKKGQPGMSCWTISLPSCMSCCTISLPSCMCCCTISLPSAPGSALHMCAVRCSECHAVSRDVLCTCVLHAALGAMLWPLMCCAHDVLHTGVGAMLCPMLCCAHDVLRAALGAMLCPMMCMLLCIMVCAGGEGQGPAQQLIHRAGQPA